MADEKRDSTQTLLDDIEGGWASGGSSGRMPAAEPAPTSTPKLDSIDAGWIDELFDEEEDEEDDEPDEPEPELPDAKIDPVAYAAAKKAREERAEARRQKRKAKAEAKRAKRKARAEAARQGQRQRKKKAAGNQGAAHAQAQRGRLPAEGGRTSAPSRRPSADAPEAAAPEDAYASEPAPAPRKQPPPPSPIPSGPPWRLLAIAAALFLATAALVGVIASR